MQDKWIFRNEGTKKYVEQLINDREKEEKEIETLVEKIASLPEGSEKELYENLLVDAKSRIPFFEGMIQEMTTEEHVYTEEEIAEGRFEDPVSDEQFWGNLMTNENLETAEFAEDVLAIKDSVEDAVKFAEKADADLAEVEEIMEETIKQVENLADSDNTKTLNSLCNDLKKYLNENKGNLSQEELEFVTNLEKSLADWRNATPVEKLGEVEKETVKQLSKEAVAKHPIQYAIAEMKQTLSEIKDARLYYKQAHGNFLNTLKDCGKAAITESERTLVAVRVSIMNTVKNNLEMAAKTLNAAAMGFMDLAQKGKQALLKGTREIVRFSDKLGDAITLGGYSKLMAALEKANKNMKEKLFKEDSFSYKMNQFMEKSHEKIRGMDSESYWKDISDNAFCWGNITNEKGDIVGYEKSPVQALQDNTSAFVGKVVAKSKEEGQEICNMCKAAKLTLEAEALDFKAIMAEGLASMYEKKERRVQSKISQLEKTDKELFEVNVQLKHALHKLNEVTPFVRPEYEPNPQLMEAREILSKASPSASVELAKRILDKDIAKEKAKFERKANGKEFVYNVKGAVNTAESAIKESQIRLNAEKMRGNLNKLQNANDRLEGIQTKKGQLTQMAKDLGTKAAQKMSQAQEKVTDDFER